MALGPRDSARYSPYASPSALRGWKTKLREEFLPGANWCFFQRWRGPARGAVAAADAPCLEDRDAERHRDLLERALAIDEREYGPEHREVAKTLVNLGNAYGDLGAAARKWR